MSIELITTEPHTPELVKAIEDLVKFKIASLEKSIHNQMDEEEIKLRETNIKQLQKQLHDLRNVSKQKHASCQIDFSLNIHLAN